MTHVSIAVALLLMVPTGVPAQGPTRDSAQTPPAQGPSQGPTSRPAILAQLLGNWDGQGTVTGRASAITMTWADDMGGAFVHLRFRNVMAPSASRPQDVFEGRGYYRVVGRDANAGTGTWIDSRGLILPLTVAVTADAVTTEWGSSSTESGRTVYRLTGPDTLDVRDFVRGSDGQFREFGVSTLTRQRP